MKPLIYILTKTFKNIVLELKKKKWTLIAYLFAVIAFIIMITISFIMPTRALKIGSVDTYSTIISAVLIAIIYLDIKQGIDSGSSFFRLADVNFIFTAPISSKHVLLYGFIKQFFRTFLMLLFLSFQIPNLKYNFAINTVGVLIIYVSTFFLFFTMPLIGMLIYSITSRSKKIRANFEKGLNYAVYISAGVFLLILLKTEDFGKAAQILLNSDYFTLIPFIGWFKVIFLSVITGIGFSFYLNVLLVLISTALMVYIVYKMKADYYEDVLAATEKKEEFLKNRREGKISTSLFRNAKHKKVRHTYKGGGAKTIFYRHLLEYKKVGMFFINRNTVILLIIGLGAKQFFDQADIFSVFYFSVYMLFFFSLTGKWVQELEKPYIYLIPARSSSKVFYATLAENLKNGVDGLVLFTAFGIAFQSNIIIVLLSAVAYMTFGAIYIYGEVLSRKLFGSAHSRNLEMFIKMFIAIFIIAPGIAMAFLFSTVSTYYPYIVLISYNVMASSLIMLFSRGIFKELEMR